MVSLVSLVILGLTTGELTPSVGCDIRGYHIAVAGKNLGENIITVSKGNVTLLRKRLRLRLGFLDEREPMEVIAYRGKSRYLLDFEGASVNSYSLYVIALQLHPKLQVFEVGSFLGGYALSKRWVVVGEVPERYYGAHPFSHMTSGKRYYKFSFKVRGWPPRFFRTGRDTAITNG